MFRILMIWCCCGIGLPYTFGQLFEDRSDLLPSPAAMGQSMDVKAADINQDGLPDIILANEFQRNTILLNSNDGYFIEMVPNPFTTINHDSEDVVVEDFNSDGFLDIIFCSEDDVNLGRTDVHEYYLGDGTGSFSIASYRFPDTEANAVIAVDVNADGHLDVLFGNNGPLGCFINNGNGVFTEESDRFPTISRTTQDLLAFDADGDDDLDVFESNENGNVLYLNDGTGNFNDVTSTHLPVLNIETRKASAADIDADGDADLFLSNVAFISGRDRQNRLLLNDGTGIFSDATLTQLPVDHDHTIDGIFANVDDDDDLDIVVANVFGGPVKIYINDGAGTFSDESTEILGANYILDALGVIFSDLNADERSDLYVCDRNTGTLQKDLLLTEKKSLLNHENK